MPLIQAGILREAKLEQALDKETAKPRMIWDWSRLTWDPWRTRRLGERIHQGRLR